MHCFTEGQTDYYQTYINFITGSYALQCFLLVLIILFCTLIYQWPLTVVMLPKLHGDKCQDPFKGKKYVFIKSQQCILFIPISMKAGTKNCQELLKLACWCSWLDGVYNKLKYYKQSTLLNLYHRHLSVCTVHKRLKSILNSQVISRKKCVHIVS